MSGTILWDVDTQVDFVLPDGKLYVPGAEQVAPAMRLLVEAARAAGVVHVASADDHELTDAEISEQPDFQTTYPPHCLRGTRGARKVDETEQEDPVPIGLELLPDRYFRGREFLILKKNFDVFTNPNTEPLLDALEPVAVESIPYVVDEPLVHAPRVEVAHLVPQRPVDELSRRVEANTP